MNSITPKNIKSFIKFLYKFKYSKYPKKEIVDSWTKLTQSEIDEHLDLLFKSWKVSSYTKRKIIDSFVHNKVNKNRFIISIFILVVFVLFFIYIIEW